MTLRIIEGAADPGSKEVQIYPQVSPSPADPRDRALADVVTAVAKELGLGPSVLLVRVGDGPGLLTSEEPSLDGGPMTITFSRSYLDRLWDAGTGGWATMEVRGEPVEVGSLAAATMLRHEVTYQRDHALAVALRSAADLGPGMSPQAWSAAIAFLLAGP